MDLFILKRRQCHMTTSLATAPPRRALRKRAKPTTLSPLPHNQNDDVASTVPLDVVFLSRFRRVLRQHIALSGWDPTDADLALLLTSRDGLHARVDSLTLDDCARVTVDGLRQVLPVLLSISTLRLSRCTSLSCDLVTFLPTTLTDIDLSYCEWLEDHGVRVLARRCVALRSVALTHCRKLTDYGVSAFADVVGLSLTTINLNRLPRVTDSCLLALLLRCSRLQRLEASRLSSLEGLNLQGLPRNTAPTLTSLDLSSNAHMHPLTIAHLVRSLYAGVLTELDVSHCAQLTDDTLVALGRYAPSLRTLRLAFCTQLTDAGVTRLVIFQQVESEYLADFVVDDAVRPRCTQLKTLDVTGCYQVTSAGIAAVAITCPTLTMLQADGLRRLDAHGLHALATNCLSLHTLQWRGILIQSGPNRGTSATGFFSVPTIDRAAAHAMGRFHSLHTLHLGATKCDVDAFSRVVLTGRVGLQLRDLDASGIATDALCLSLASHCHGLHTLRLRRSRYFSLDAFLAVATSCTQLRTLDLESCEQLQDVALTTLGRHAGATLETLVLSNDWQLTDRGIMALAHRCPRLRRLTVRHCPEVSPLCLKDIATRVNAFVVATRDGLEPKPGNVAAFIALDQALDTASRRLGRWWRNTIADRSHAQSAIERALRHVRHRRRCVVRLQRCIRRWLAHKRHQTLVAQALHARRQQCLVYWGWIVATCRLARLLRTYTRRWCVQRHELAFRQAEAERQRRTNAATTIQRVYWGWCGRRRATQRRQDLMLLRQRQHASALRLQRVWRGHRGLVKAHETARLQYQRLLAMTAEAERRGLAALQLTRHGRGFLGRRCARHLQIEQLAWLERRELAAHTIQRAGRAYLARILFRRRRVYGVIAMQRVGRGFLGRQHARVVVLTRAYTRPPILLLLSTHSVFTRPLAVVWKTKHDAAERIALASQCWFRGYYNGRLVRRQQLGQRRQQAFVLDTSARTLQHFFRSLLIVRRLAELQTTLRLRQRSATKLQSLWRMWCGRVHATAAALRRDRQRRHVALRSAILEPHSTRQLLQLGAIHVLATTYRQALALRGWLAPSAIRRLHHSATKIQSLVRGVQTRQSVAQWRIQLTWATNVVQRVWRGKRGRMQWRKLMAERRRAQQLQQEQDRATRVASKRTGQMVLEAASTFDHHARVLQQWVCTLQRRQVLQQASDARAAARRTRATQRLASVLTLATESVVFQARVWRECMDHKVELNALEESDVIAMEREVAALKRSCLEEYVAHAAAASQYQELGRRKRDAVATKKRLRIATESMKATIQPFAEQATHLTLASARVHTTNRQLQDELRLLRRGIASFHRALETTLPLEPLLYERDVETLVTMLALPPGRESLVAAAVDPKAN